MSMKLYTKKNFTQTMSTKTPVIPRAIFDFVFWINVKKRTFFVTALTWTENQFKDVGKVKTIIRLTKIQAWIHMHTWIRLMLSIICNTHQIWKRNSTLAFWTCHTHEETRSHLPFYKGLVANVCRLLSDHLWHGEKGRLYPYYTLMRGRMCRWLTQTLKKKNHSHQTRAFS